MSQGREDTKKENNSIFPSGDQETPLDPMQRRTGTDLYETDVRPGAEPEAPGNKDTDKPGNPNQGTDAR